MKTLTIFILIIILFPYKIFSQWEERGSGTNAFLSGIYFLNDQTGWIVYKDSCLWTTDSGKNWQSIMVSNTGKSLYDLSFVSSEIGIATSSNGTVFLTFDGGLNWAEQNTLTGSENYFGISYIEDVGRHAWIVGTSGKIAYSSNNGSSWTTQATGSFALNDIYFTSKDSGWSVGNNGTILQTSNGGNNNSWSLQQSNTASDLFGIWFYNSKIGWIAGENGLILNTVDGGNNWQGQNSGITSTLFKISFCDRLNGVAVGLSGTILHTTDGGNNWLNESGIVNTTIYDVHYQSIENCWAVGENGKILYSVGSIKINSPTGSERFEEGTNQTITWESSYTKNVRIDLSTDNGNTWDKVITDQTSAISGSFNNWNVKNTPSSQCRIRVQSLKDSNVQAISQQFAIYQKIAPTVFVSTDTLRPQKNKDLFITATITDDNSTIDTLFYRMGGDKYYQHKSMEPFGVNQFLAKIPADEIDESGLEFYIKSVDTSPEANVGYFPADSADRPEYLPVTINDYVHPLLSSNPNNGGEGEIYQLVSIPYKLNDTNIDNVLSDDFGTYDVHNWRLWQWLGDSDGYGEFTKQEIGGFTQGKSFWLASTKSSFTGGTGQSFKPTNFSISLQPGWNQIGTPFAFSISTNDIYSATADTTDLTPIYEYNNGWAPVSVLEPGKGYFVENRAAVNKTLIVPPIASTGLLGKLYKVNSTLASNGWEINLKATAKNFADNYNIIGAYKDASLEWDIRDLPEPPPPVGKYITIYFPHKDWQKYPDNYTTDFRSSISGSEIWDFIVETNIENSSADISFEGVENIPSEFGVYIIDREFQISQNLRQNPVYKLPLTSSPMKKHLELFVGKPDYFQNTNQEKNEIPKNFELSQNFPNPFNPTTTIRYGIPADGIVTIKIYNAIGEEIITLINYEQKSAGYYFQTWNGCDGHGETVPSGIYFYRIESGSFVKTRKMILIR